MMLTETEDIHLSSSLVAEANVNPSATSIEVSCAQICVSPHHSPMTHPTSPSFCRPPSPRTNTTNASSPLGQTFHKSRPFMVGSVEPSATLRSSSTLQSLPRSSPVIGSSPDPHGDTYVPNPSMSLYPHARSTAATPPLFDDFSSHNAPFATDSLASLSPDSGHMPQSILHSTEINHDLATRVDYSNEAELEAARDAAFTVVLSNDKKLAFVPPVAERVRDRIVRIAEAASLNPHLSHASSPTSSDHTHLVDTTLGHSLEYSGDSGPDASFPLVPLSRHPPPTHMLSKPDVLTLALEGVVDLGIDPQSLGAHDVLKPMNLNWRDLTSRDACRDIPITRQGDLSMYEPEALEMRQSIRFHPSIILHMRRLWAAVRRTPSPQLHRHRQQTGHPHQTECTSSSNPVTTTFSGLNASTRPNLPTDPLDSPSPVVSVSGIPSHELPYLRPLTDGIDVSQYAHFLVLCHLYLLPSVPIDVAVSSVLEDIALDFTVTNEAPLSSTLSADIDDHPMTIEGMNITGGDEDGDHGGGLLLRPPRLGSLIPFVRFHDAVFQLVDIWTNSCDVREYVNFLERLYRCITIPAVSSRYTPSTVLGGQIQWDQPNEGWSTRMLRSLPRQSATIFNQFNFHESIRRHRSAASTKPKRIVSSLSRADLGRLPAHHRPKPLSTGAHSNPNWQASIFSHLVDAHSSSPGSAHVYASRYLRGGGRLAPKELLSASVFTGPGLRRFRLLHRLPPNYWIIDADSPSIFALDDDRIKNWSDAFPKRFKMFMNQLGSLKRTSHNLQVSGTGDAPVFSYTNIKQCQHCAGLHCCSGSNRDQGVDIKTPSPLSTSLIGCGRSVCSSCSCHDHPMNPHRHHPFLSSSRLPFTNTQSSFQPSVTPNQCGWMETDRDGCDDDPIHAQACNDRTLSQGISRPVLPTSATVFRNMELSPHIRCESKFAHTLIKQTIHGSSPSAPMSSSLGKPSIMPRGLGDKRQPQSSYDLKLGSRAAGAFSKPSFHSDVADDYVNLAPDAPSMEESMLLQRLDQVISSGDRISPNHPSPTISSTSTSTISAPLIADSVCNHPGFHSASSKSPRSHSFPRSADPLTIRETAQRIGFCLVDADDHYALEYAIALSAEMECTKVNLSFVPILPSSTTSIEQNRPSQASVLPPVQLNRPSQPTSPHFTLLSSRDKHTQDDLEDHVKGMYADPELPILPRPESPTPMEPLTAPLHSEPSLVSTPSLPPPSRMTRRVSLFCASNLNSPLSTPRTPAAQVSNRLRRSISIFDGTVDLNPIHAELNTLDTQLRELPRSHSVRVAPATAHVSPSTLSQTDDSSRLTHTGKLSSSLAPHTVSSAARPAITEGPAVDGDDSCRSSHNHLTVTDLEPPNNNHRLPLEPSAPVAGNVATKDGATSVDKLPHPFANDVSALRIRILGERSNVNYSSSCPSTPLQISLDLPSSTHVTLSSHRLTSPSSSLSESILSVKSDAAVATPRIDPDPSGLLSTLGSTSSVVLPPYLTPPRTLLRRGSPLRSHFTPFGRDSSPDPLYKSVGTDVEPNPNSIDAGTRSTLPSPHRVSSSRRHSRRTTSRQGRSGRKTGLHADFDWEAVGIDNAEYEALIEAASGNVVTLSQLQKEEAESAARSSGLVQDDSIDSHLHSSRTVKRRRAIVHSRPITNARGLLKASHLIESFGIGSSRSRLNGSVSESSPSWQTPTASLTDAIMGSSLGHAVSNSISQTHMADLVNDLWGYSAPNHHPEPSSDLLSSTDFTPPRCPTLSQHPASSVSSSIPLPPSSSCDFERRCAFAPTRESVQNTPSASLPPLASSEHSHSFPIEGLHLPDGGDLRGRTAPQRSIIPAIRSNTPFSPSMTAVNSLTRGLGAITRQSSLVKSSSTTIGPSSGQSDPNDCEIRATEVEATLRDSQEQCLGRLRRQARGYDLLPTISASSSLSQACHQPVSSHLVHNRKPPPLSSSMSPHPLVSESNSSIAKLSGWACSSQSSIPRAPTSLFTHHLHQSSNPVISETLHDLNDEAAAAHALYHAPVRKVRMQSPIGSSSPMSYTAPPVQSQRPASSPPVIPKAFGSRRLPRFLVTSSTMTQQSDKPSSLSAGERQVLANTLYAARADKWHVPCVSSSKRGPTTSLSSASGISPPC